MTKITPDYTTTPNLQNALKMRVFRGFDSLPPFRHAVATMGSFDGVHRGHQVLLQRTVALAKERGGESIVLTFEPHPRYVLGTDEGMKLLSVPQEKLWLLEQSGIENVIIIPFTKEFSRLSPKEFIAKDIAGIGVECFVVGYNHRFGHNKEGDYSMLKNCEQPIEIHRVEQQLLDNGKVSSTVIRKAIAEGKVAHACELLAHPYIIMCQIDSDGKISDIDNHKLLPPVGKYEIKVKNYLNINNIEPASKALLEIGNNNELKISKSHNLSKVILEITSDKTL